VQVIWSIGKVLAPLIVGVIIVAVVTMRIIAVAWIVLIISFLFFLALLFTMRKLHLEKRSAHGEKQMSFLCEAQLWKGVGRSLAPLLLMTFFLYLMEAFFWTIAPLYANDLHSARFGGIFLAAYSLPPLLSGWCVGSVAKRIETKKMAFWGVLAGSLLLSFFPFISSPFGMVILVFIVSLLVSFSFPAIDGLYADYIQKFPKAESEIEGLADVMYNFGYILGPLCAGVLADAVGIPFAFSVLGIGGAVLAVIFLKITPYSTRLNVKPY
jgi:MFS family permease